MNEDNNRLNQQSVSESFGSRRPPQFFNWMIAFLHHKKPSVFQRLLAPVARKIIVNFSRLPIDIVAGDLQLRCQFTDNYSEKKYVFTPWRYDNPELTALQNALPEDGVFVDIGANVGIYSLFAASSLGRQGVILAMEPNPLTLQRLQINLGANVRQDGSWPDIRVLNIGIADENAERQLQIDDHNLGACSIAKTSDSDSQQSIHCRLLTDVLSEQKIEHIDVLKIDIEGAEDIALMPFLEKTHDSLLPKLIIIENSSHVWSQDLFGKLTEKGYKRILKTRLNSVLKLS